MQPTIPNLREKYNAAYTAYQQCVQQVSDLTTAGATPSRSLLDHEARALNELIEARGALLAAIRLSLEETGSLESDPQSSL